MLAGVRISVFVGIGLAVVGSGCVAAPIVTRGYPLYAEAGGRPSASQVATLSALLPGGGAPGAGSTNFIRAVDGRDVSSLDTAFELLPGCHVVETDSELRFSDAMVTWSAQIGSRAFLFQMKPGYEYLVVVELSEGMSGTGRVSIYGVEQDPTGRRTARFSPVAPEAAARACHEPAGGAHL
jgi:hypothetical protein